MADETSPDDARSTASANELERALERQEFFLVYQPEIDLGTNAFTGVEALLRWRTATNEVLDPGEFVPELETSGLIVDVGRWTLLTACTQGTQWHNRGYRFSVSVNVAAPQIERPDFVEVVDAALADSHFDASQLVLEFSQRTLTDHEALADQLSALRLLGVRVAIDDFVPGPLALDQIETWPIDIVKLDRGFIAGLADSSASALAVHAMMDRAKSMDVRIIASGIEDAEQRRRLQLEAVNTGQGYLFSKPHEAAEIDRYLEDFSIFSGKPL